MGFSFSDYIELLEQVLAGRQAIVEGLERQLFSARGKANAQNGDRESIADIFGGCFFESPAISQRFSSLNGQLEAAHLADGFEPSRQDGYSRVLDPVELVFRACHHWDLDRWPGRTGRIVYAQSLYAVFVLRQLELLSLRIWTMDDGRSTMADPAARLQRIQHLLDLLNAGSEAGQGVRLVHDARWLIQTAQGPLTRHVTPYFIKAGQASASFTGNDSLEIHKAGAVLAGGHLRSQLRHVSRRTGWAFDDPQLLALTRSSNSMDMALLVRDLVPLLEAYRAACRRQDNDARPVLADAILQGLSADPELLLTRLDLLGPSTMIEDLFLNRGDTGVLAYSAIGKAHREHLARYGELLGQTAASLQEDSRALDPADAPYSPLALVYGFCADLFSNMVLNTLRTPSSTDLGLEDLFDSGGDLEKKRTRANEWARLPKREGERDAFEYSTEWAAQMHARLARALRARAAHPAETNASQFTTSHLYVVPRRIAIEDARLPAGIVAAQEHCLTSDVSRARDTGATALPADRLIGDRAEGHLLACVHADDAWFGVSKLLLTLFTSQGKDALIADVPRAVIDVLRVVCPDFLVVIGEKS